MDDSAWDSLLGNISAGECTPVIGLGACYQSLPGLERAAQEWAQQYDYPFTKVRDLTHVAQFLAVRHNPPTPKERLQSLYRRLPTYDFITTPEEPHSLLASLPLPIYLTTNYDDCMFNALVSRGKIPTREIFRWSYPLHNERSALEQGFVPTVSNPLVFHLNGHYDQRLSLVLTEDDYLTFLENIAAQKFKLPELILEKLTRTSLMFIGYDLDEWSFRVLLRLIAQTPPGMRGTSVTVQLPPSSDEVAVQEAAQSYLEAYFKQKELAVYWGDTSEFITELAQHWKESNPEELGAPNRQLVVEPPVDRGRLRDTLTDSFSLEDLASLCLDIEQALRNDQIELRVSLDLFGDGKLSKVLGLIEYLDRRNHLVYLVKAVRQLRPGML